MRRAVPRAATATAIVVGLLLGGLLWVLLRPRRTPSGSTAALWIEEHHPGAPSFALVTLVELASEAGSAAYDGSELHRASERMLRQVSIGDALSTLRWQQWRGPVSFVAVSVLLLVMSGMLAPRPQAWISRPHAVPDLGLQGKLRLRSAHGACG